MPYLVRDLIADAYNTSGLVAPVFESVSGPQQEAALRWLNALLDYQSVRNSLIPYFQEYTFPSVTAQEKYSIPNLLKVETVTFNLGATQETVRFPVTSQTRKQYFGTARANGVTSIMTTFHLERTKEGADIYFYFLPNTIYPVKLWGKFGFDSVEEQDDLDEVYNKFYSDYLKYELAWRICSNTNITFQPEAKEILNQYRYDLRDISARDLTVQKISTLRKGQVYNWAQANIGRGWTSGGSRGGL